jgi:hypothetical protein
MSSDEQKIALANLMIRKAGLIRTSRDVLHDRNEAHHKDLTEILNAVERAYAEEQAQKEASR